MRTSALFTLLAPLALLMASGCATPNGATTSSSVSGATRLIYRGVPQVDRAVVQARVGANVPDSYGNEWFGRLWANANGGESVGAGVFPDGKGGEVSRYDFSGGVRMDVPGGELELSFLRLFVSGDDSPIGATTEVAVAYSMPGMAWNPRFSFAYEVDDVKDFYAAYETSHPIAVEQTWSAEMWGRVGLVGSEYAFQYFGERSGGFSDVIFGPRFAVELRRGVVLRGDLLMHYAVEEAYRKRLRGMGITPDNLVASIGVEWTL